MLPQIQSNIRRTLRRPDDPSGTSTAGWQKFDSAHALLPLIPTKPARFMAGQRPLTGVDFELVDLLGIGGFGEVWRAKHLFMPNTPQVALKFCLDAAAARTLRNEAALLDQIVHHGKHPGIVELRATYLSAEIPSLQYEYIAGGDLADLIKQWYAQPTPPSVDVIRESLLELAQTMAFAHAAGIVHRDLKPANILIPVSAAFTRLRKSALTRDSRSPTSASAASKPRSTTAPAAFTPSACGWRSRSSDRTPRCTPRPSKLTEHLRIPPTMSMRWASSGIKCSPATSAKGPPPAASGAAACCHAA